MATPRAVLGWVVTLAVSCGILAMPLVALAATFQVNIQNFAYAPNPIAIRVGDTVRWTNLDASAHSARFAGMSTAILLQGQSGSLTFGAAGTFPYDCGVHGSAMTGTVVVQAAATPAPTPQPTPQPTPPPTPQSTPQPTPPPTPLPTPVRTAPPTVAPTPAPTVAPTAAPTTEAPSPTPTPTAIQTLAVASPSPTPLAVQITAGPAPADGPGPALIVGALAAVLALGAIAFVLMRRT